MLTTLGIYAAVALIAGLQNIPSRAGHIWLMLVCVLVLAAIVFYVIRLLVLDNDSLVSKITAQQDQTEDFDQRIYLIKAFRIAFVLLALLLLCSPSTVRVTFMMFKAFSLSNIRMWITDVIQTKGITGNLSFSRYTGMYIAGIIKLTVIAYLLSGATHIIRWHLKHSCLNQKTEGLTNE